MPGIDWIPLVSQVKALAQAVTGDTEGAKRTAENFVRECPGVSQVTSVVQLCSGDVQGAIDTQKMCMGTVSNVANGIPVVGHAKGLIHHAVGDHEGGDQAFNAASRTTVVMASGVAAGITTGGLAAIPAGVAAGMAYDATETAITGKPAGYMAAIKNVADNPSAGSIIDAIAIPVGDGMAGYSGGQIGNRIQLSRLENLRDTALENMESAATSGEALKYGDQAMALDAKINDLKGVPHFTDGAKGAKAAPGTSSSNALHAEINDLKGAPHFTDGVKAATAAPATSSSSVGVPVAGYVNEDGQEQETTGIAAAVTSRATPTRGVEQEDALHYDSYVEVIITDSNNRAQAQQAMRERDNESASGNLLESYRNVQFTTVDGLNDLLQSTQNPQNPHDNNWRSLLEQLFSLAWLPLNMPQEFNYTAVAQVNSVYSGLLHSFIRHMFEWDEVIPSLDPQIRRLAPIMWEIALTSAANNVPDARDARDAFKQALEQLRQRDSEQYIDVRSAFIEIQMQQHRFMERCMTYEKYLGRSVNTLGQQRLYFQVELDTGLPAPNDRMTKVMVVCLSDVLYHPVAGNERPVRMLMTVFFESLDVFISHGLLETKEEMENNNENNN